ncbi:MAG: AmmeMemoRadiSam system protein B [Rhodospirillales bacterium]|nr:AmmeMemoRadiSam system protein B [Rhodospirillales bacterium]
MTLTTARTLSSAHIRPPAVAGAFYPAVAGELKSAVRHYLERAKTEIGAHDGPAPKAIIAPHAGYIYSGLTAAAAYNALAPAKAMIKRVVILGPCHRVGVKGLALPSATAFRTPLGDVPVDRDAAAMIQRLPQVQVFDATHADDHAIEVHLPFLQEVLDNFSIVPLIVGEASVDEVVEVLRILWGGPETLILISSDLSHYLPYSDAQASDDGARRAIEQLSAADLGEEQACGRHSIRPLLTLAHEKGLSAVTADVRNSGDTAGDKSRVVGYGSWLFFAGAEPDSATAGIGGETRAMLGSHGAELLKFGAHAITAKLNGAAKLDVRLDSFPKVLSENRACFVTLEKEGKLRGCIGSVQAHQPLIADVAENACRAAFQDPRFSPLAWDELKASHISMHLSVLSPQVPMHYTSEADLVSQLRPGIDGVVLTDQGKRGVFLPVVWGSLPEPDKFFRKLKLKAGLAEDHWSGSVRAWRYTTEGVSSDDLPDAAEFWVVGPTG